MSNQKVEIVWGLNGEFFIEVNVKLLSPTLLQPNLLSVRIPRFQTSPQKSANEP